MDISISTKMLSTSAVPGSVKPKFCMSRKWLVALAPVESATVAYASSLAKALSVLDHATVPVAELSDDASGLLSLHVSPELLDEDDSELSDDELLSSSEKTLIWLRTSGRSGCRRPWNAIAWCLSR